MRGKISDIFLTILFMIFDGAGIVGSFILASIIRENKAFLLEGPEALPMIYLMIGANILVALFMKSYKDLLIRGKYVEAGCTLKHVFVTVFVAFIVKFLLHIEFVISRMIIGLTILFSIVILYILRVILKRICRKIARESDSIQNILVISNYKEASNMLKNIGDLVTYNYRVIGLAIMDENHVGESIDDVTVLTNREDIMNFASGAKLDAVYIQLGMGNSEDKELFHEFVDMGIMVYLCMDSVLQEYPNGRFSQLGESHVIASKAKQLSDGEVAAKRFLDIIGGLVGSLFTIILTIIVGPIIFICSPGPIFFAQTRVGLNGRKFKIYKFRSMYKDAEARKAELMKQNEMQGLMFKMENDPRIIKGIGKFIRDTSIDEFPQFFNVLKGDMSLVGTRPPTVDEYEQYTPRQKSRLSMKPGITGLWQVSGRSDITDFDEIVHLDRKYINNWSFGKDLRILGKTVAVVFTRKGAK